MRTRTGGGFLAPWPRSAIFAPRKLFSTVGCGGTGGVDVVGFGQTGNPYGELGVPTVINCEGTMTVLGGSVLRPELEAVMAMADRHFGSIPDLEVAAGKRIAEMLKLPDGNTALVTSGAAAAIQSGLTGMKSGVIDQKSHRSPFSVTPQQVSKLLRNSKPAIFIGGGEGRQGLQMCSFMPQPGEDEIVAQQLSRVLREHAA